MDAVRTDSRAGGTERFYPLIIAGFCVLFYLPYFFTATTNLIPTYQDESQWWLYTMFINQSFARGFFPLWTSDLACGMPFLAWSHSAAFYPSNLLFALLEFGRAFWIVQFLHQVLFSLGVYWLCRRLKASPGAALAATLIASAQYVNGPIANFLPNLRTGSWGPLWLLCFHALMTERRLRWLLYFTLITFVMFLGGQVELIGLGWELLGVCSLAAAVIVYRRDGLRPLLPPAGLFVAAFALSYLISQIQALPTLELTHFSIRGKGLTYDYFRIWSNWNNASFWLPYVFSGVTAVAVVAGIVSARRSANAAVLAVGFLFSVALIQNLFGFMRIMYLIPVARGLLAQSRIYAFATVLLAALMAIGFDAMLASPARRRWLRAAGFAGLLESPPIIWFLLAHPELVLMGEQSMLGMIRVLITVTAATLALAMPFYLALTLAPARLADNARASLVTLAGVALLVLAVPVAASMPKNPLDPFGVSPAYVKFFESHRGLHRTQVIYPWDRWERLHIPVQSGILAGTRSADAFITVSLDRYTRLIGAFLPDTILERDGYIGGLLATKVLKDSTITEKQNWPLLDLLGIKYLVTQEANLRSPTVYFLAYPDSELAQSQGVTRDPDPAKNRPDRLTISSRAKTRLQLSPGDRLDFTAWTKGGWVQAIATAGNRPRLVATKFLADTTWTMSGVLADADGPGILSLSSLPPAAAILRLPRVINDKKHFRLAFQDENFNVFENPTALPAAFIPESVVELPKDEALRFMRANTDPARKAVVEGALPPAASPLKPGEGVTVTDYTPEWLALHVTTRSPRLVVLTDSIFPGWHAMVDGKDERIRPADYAFRGVPAPRGKSRMEMVYRPVSFRLGLWITLATLAGLAAAAIARRS